MKRIKSYVKFYNAQSTNFTQNQEWLMTYEAFVTTLRKSADTAEVSAAPDGRDFKKNNEN